MNIFSPKDPNEVIVLTFDFTTSLVTGETLTGSPTVTISAAIGVDAAMAAMLSGAPSIVGNTVLQKVINGVVKNSYGFIALCTLSSGRMLAVGGILPINVAYAI